MKIADIETYRPQRIFLVQGSEKTYGNLLSELKTSCTIVHTLMVPRLTMEHGKNIVSTMSEQTGEERAMLIYFSVFSPDAAQVLLKTLEEPEANLLLILMTPYPYVVPATIRSRVMIIPADCQDTQASTLTKAEAEAFIKKELSSDAEEDAATRRAKAVAFLDELELRYRKTPTKAQIIYEAKHLLFHANIPTKYVVEYAVSFVM